MDPDPNWFYSTLAQSTAAIVGLIGGFFVARMINQREDIADHRTTLRDQAHDHWSRRIIEQREAAIQVVNSLFALLEKMEEAAHAGQESVRIEAGQIVAVLAPPPQAPSVATKGLILPVSVNRADELREAIEVVSAWRDALPTNWLEWTESLEKHSGRWLPPEATWIDEQAWADVPKPDYSQMRDQLDWLPFQREIIRERWRLLNNDTEIVASNLRQFRARLVPRSFYTLLGILGALLGVGVFAPMFFLSSRGDYSRTVLLLAFGVLALALVLYFVFEVFKLRRADRLARDTF